MCVCVYVHTRVRAHVSQTCACVKLWCCFSGITLFPKIYFFVYVFMYASVCMNAKCVQSSEATGGSWISWSTSYKLLSAKRCECWEPSLDPLEKQHVTGTTENSPVLHIDSQKGSLTGTWGLQIQPGRLASQLKGPPTSASLVLGFPCVQSILGIQLRF